MASPNIFQAYLQPPKSMLDYSNEMDKADANKLALIAQQRQNELAGLQMDQTRGQMADATAKRNAIQSVFAQLGPQATPMDRARALQANPLTANEGVAAEKAIVENQKLGSETAKNQAETDAKIADARYKAADRHVQELAYVQSPADVVEYVKKTLDIAGIPQEQRQQALQQALQKAQQLGLDGWKQATAQGAIPVLDKFKQDAEMARTKLTTDTQITTTGMNNATSRANNAAQVGATIRGQNLTDARAKEKNSVDSLANGKAPVGYVWGPAGPDGNPTLVAVKGGPADLKIAGQLNQDTQNLTGAVSGLDRLATQANEVLNHPGLKGITGIRGAIPNIPGSEAADAQAKLATLKSQVGFGVLQDMRNNSKTGGALGAVSDAEGKRLEANLAALEKAQSLDQFKSELKKIIDYTQGAKDRIREAYNLKHGPGSVNPAPAGAQSAPAPAAATKTVNFGDLK